MIWNVKRGYVKKCNYFVGGGQDESERIEFMKDVLNVRNLKYAEIFSLCQFRGCDLNKIFLPAISRILK